MPDQTNHAPESAGTCPLCGQANGCMGAAGRSHAGCWCAHEVFPQELFKRVPKEFIGKACICKECLEAFKRNGE
ncbi:cysteine-rich CWC family protein [Paenibacillus rhizophilus]|uniref:Cysteine-rich CWC family protein n=1 Tax=Paenibacillus rhizophilus TaxID=1850366 RepID=A0A3N9PDG0_9BACL|nr:cysteine-rich CWC family protein [Paenibacillus rhizophilus]RQW13054.1 hypothetical protein EH198_01080 [Paenibacillus rhizophilus]